MARPLITVRWTPEQDERLKLLAARSASAVKAAAALNRTIVSVQARSRKLGLVFPSAREARKKWMPEKRNKNDVCPY